MSFRTVAQNELFQTVYLTNSQKNLIVGQVHLMKEPGPLVILFQMLDTGLYLLDLLLIENI